MSKTVKKDEVQEAKNDVSAFAKKWMGKTALLDGFVREAKQLLISLNIVENKMDALRVDYKKTEEALQALRDEHQKRMDTEQHSLDNLQSKLTEERIALSNEKRKVKIMQEELSRKLAQADADMVKAGREKAAAASKAAGN